MGALTVVGICNRALAHIGESRIAVITENSEPARLCNLFYDSTRDEALRGFPWPSAIHRQRVAEIDLEETLSVYEHAYQLPTSPYCLRVLEVVDAESGVPTKKWAIEGRKLYAAQENIAIKYIKRVTDPTEFDISLANAITYGLAVKLAWRLTGDQNISNRMAQFYQMTLVQAQADSGEQIPLPDADKNWSDI